MRIITIAAAGDVGRDLHSALNAVRVQRSFLGIFHFTTLLLNLWCCFVFLHLFVMVIVVHSFRRTI